MVVKEWFWAFSCVYCYKTPCKPYNSKMLSNLPHTHTWMYLCVVMPWSTNYRLKCFTHGKRRRYHWAIACCISITYSGKEKCIFSNKEKKHRNNKNSNHLEWRVRACARVFANLFSCQTCPHKPDKRLYFIIHTHTHTNEFCDIFYMIIQQ